MLFYENSAAFLEGQRRYLERLSKANIPEIGLITNVLVPDSTKTRETNPHDYSVTHKADSLEINSFGIRGDRHFGPFCRSTGREREMYPSKTLISGQRKVFAVCMDDCRILSRKIGVEVTPELLGANLVIEREDGAEYCLSELPPTTRIAIAQADSLHMPKPPLVNLVNYVKQQGCAVTGNAIAHRYRQRTLCAKFIENSKDNRGIVCNIEYPAEEVAIIRPGMRVFFRFPMGVTT